MRKLHLLVTDAETGKPITVEEFTMDVETESLMLLIGREIDGSPAVTAVGCGLAGWRPENRRKAPIQGLMTLLGRLCGGEPEERTSGIMEACDAFAKMLMERLDGKTVSWLLMEMAEGAARLTVEKEEASNEHRN